MIIELGSLTGEVEDAYVEVETRMGVKRLCRPMFGFPTMGRPSKNWVTKYKDKFLAIFMYENGNKEKAVMLGLIPIGDNNIPAEGLDDNIVTISEKFRTWYNDKDNKYIIDALSDGEILLGNKDVTEPALLGNKFKTWAETSCEKAKTLSTKAQDISTQCATIIVNTAVGPSSVPTNASQFTTLASDCAQLALDFQQLKTDVPNLLSQKVKLK